MKQSTADCALCRGETGVEWLCAQPHSVIHSTPAIQAETTETGIMNQMRNKKPETIMNQRIISAERAFFSLCRVVADQLLTQSIKIAAADGPASQCDSSPWQSVPSSSSLTLVAGVEGCSLQWDIWKSGFCSAWQWSHLVIIRLSWLSNDQNTSVQLLTHSPFRRCWPCAGRDLIRAGSAFCRQKLGDRSWLQAGFVFKNIHNSSGRLAGHCQGNARWSSSCIWAKTKSLEAQTLTSYAMHFI